MPACPPFEPPRIQLLSNELPNRMWDGVSLRKAEDPCVLPHPQPTLFPPEGPATETAWIGHKKGALELDTLSSNLPPLV